MKLQVIPEHHQKPIKLKHDNGVLFIERLRHDMWVHGSIHVQIKWHWSWHDGAWIKIADEISEIPPAILQSSFKVTLDAEQVDQMKHDLKELRKFK